MTNPTNKSCKSWLSLLLLLAVALVIWTAVASPILAQVEQPPVAATQQSSAKPAKSEAAPVELAPGKQWVRIVRDKNGQPQALQTAIVRYVPVERTDDTLAVDLVGAIHVADADYYEKLNKAFEGYDAVLYELVAPEGTQIPKGGRGGSTHPIGALQYGMKDMLELEHQLSKIDYTKKNMIHADMSPQQLSQAMKDSDESFTTLLFRLMGRAMAMQSKMQAEGKAADVDLLAALFAKDRARQLKIIMAEQFAEMESLLVGLGGPNGLSIIEGRNQVALGVLRKEIDGKNHKLAIFYGAGHMKDMGRRLEKDFKLKPTSVRWLTAWDLKAD